MAVHAGADNPGGGPDVGQAHRVVATPRDQFGGGLEDLVPAAWIPDPDALSRAHREPASVPSRAAGTSMARERRYSPRPLACGSGLVEAPTPAPSRPTTTKFSACRLASS